MKVPDSVPFLARMLALPAMLALGGTLAFGASAPAHAQQEPVCSEGGGFETEGSLLDRDAASGDATHVQALRYAAHEGCERTVIDLGNSEGGPAETVGQVNAAFYRDLGLVRVYLPADFPLTTVPDGAASAIPTGDFVEGMFTVFSENEARGPFVDVHLKDAVEARAFVLENPARIVVDVQPGGSALPEGATGPTENVVVVSPQSGSQVQYPIDISGYARTFEANVIARLYQGGEIVAEQSTTAAAWAEAWGQYSLTFEDGPSGNVELFVGSESAQDGSEQGVRIPLTIGQQGGNGDGNGQPNTYTVESGDTMFSIAQEFGVSLDALVNANDIENPSLIFPGQVLTIPGTGGQQPDEQLSTAIQQYVESQGETYAGPCSETNVDEHTGQYCSEIASQSGSQAVVNIGPTFSEFTQQVTFQQSNGDWQAVSEDPIETPDPGGMTYTVQSGDTLFAIAQDNGTTVEALVDANNIANPDLIFVGQELTIPS